MSSRGGKAVSAVQVATSGVASIANLTPVPYLGPAVQLVASIWGLVENMKFNKNLMRQLGLRCNELLKALNEMNSQLTPEKFTVVVDQGKVLLNGIKERMETRVKESLPKQLFLQKKIADDINDYLQEIDTFLAKFSITSQIEFQSFMAQCRLDHKKDRDDWTKFVSDVKNQHELTLEAVRGVPALTRGLMADMQEEKSTLSPGSSQSDGLSGNLWALQRASGQLLPKLELKHGEVRKAACPVAGSAQFDVYEGTYLDHAKCAVKAIRSIEINKDSDSGAKTKRRFLREVEIWRKLWETDHGEYILPFWGACFDESPYPYIVSPWMEKGTVDKYVRAYPDVNRKQIIKRIAEGVRVLHTYNPPIVHGDLRGTNILINEKGNPVIADFGLSKMMEELGDSQKFTPNNGFESFRWSAPEVCFPPGIVSCASDIFAYAMTVVEIMTGQEPYSHIESHTQVLISSTRDKERPKRPDGPNSEETVKRGLDDDLWQLLTECWRHERGSRPNIHAVLTRLPTF